LEVDADLGELSLSGDVRVTVGRYRLGGQRVLLKRGPLGINVKGGGNIAFCRCDDPPVTVGYSSVTIAPPSDVVIEGAVVRAGPVPVLWLPYLWLRSPDRLSVAFPSAEWRGEDGLLLGTGLHVPFDVAQGRPPARALDLGLFGYTDGGVRVDARLITPQSSSFVRWDYLGEAALQVDAHGSSQAETSAVAAYDVDLSRGARGRRSLTELDAAARRYDHARLGVGTTGPVLFAVGGAVAAERGVAIGETASAGPLAQLSTGGRLGSAASYAIELATDARTRPGEPRTAETRTLERGVLESALRAGPLLARWGAFQQAELLSLAEQSVSKFALGAGTELSLPLLRRFPSVTHLVQPRASARIQRVYLDDRAQNDFAATAGVVSGLGGSRRSSAGRVSLGGGVAGDVRSPKPVLEALLGADARWLGIRLSGLAEPQARSAEGTARLRLGARSFTHLTTFAEARTDRPIAAAALQAGGASVPNWQELPAYDRGGLTTGAELRVLLWSELAIWLGGDLDPLSQDLLGVRSGGAYRHACGCFAFSAFASQRIGRGGFDAGVSLDLMP